MEFTLEIDYLAIASRTSNARSPYCKRTERGKARRNDRYYPLETEGVMEFFARDREQDGIFEEALICMIVRMQEGKPVSKEAI